MLRKFILLQIHDPELLAQRMKEHGIAPEGMQG